MAVGGSGTVVSAWLNYLRGPTPTAPAGQFVKLHTGDPGAAGTSNASAVTTRNALTLTASASGSACALSSLSSYSMTATETISHVSVWDASSAGNFLYSGALTASRSVVSGDTLSFTTFGVAITPVAA